MKFEFLKLILLAHLPCSNNSKVELYIIAFFFGLFLFKISHPYWNTMKLGHHQFGKVLGSTFILLVHCFMYMVTHFGSIIMAFSAIVLVIFSLFFRIFLYGEYRGKLKKNYICLLDIA